MDESSQAIGTDTEEKAEEVDVVVDHSEGHMDEKDKSIASPKDDEAHNKNNDLNLVPLSTDELMLEPDIEGNKEIDNPDAVPLYTDELMPDNTEDLDFEPDEEIKNKNIEGNAESKSKMTEDDEDVLHLDDDRDKLEDIDTLGDEIDVACTAAPSEEGDAAATESDKPFKTKDSRSRSGGIKPISPPRRRDGRPRRRSRSSSVEILPGMSRYRRDRPGPSRSFPASSTGFKVVVRNYPPKTTDSEFDSMFVECGEILWCEKKKNLGLVTFKTKEGAEMAKEKFDGTKCGDETLSVRDAPSWTQPSSDWPPPRKVSRDDRSRSRGYDRDRYEERDYYGSSVFNRIGYEGRGTEREDALASRLRHVEEELRMYQGGGFRRDNDLDYSRGGRDHYEVPRREEDTRGQYGFQYSPRSSNHRPSEPPGFKVVVRGFPSKTTDSEFNSMFDDCGEIIWCEKKKSLGLVTFKTKAGADLCKQTYDGSKCGDESLSVRDAPAWTQPLYVNLPPPPQTIGDQESVRSDGHGSGSRRVLLPDDNSGFDEHGGRPVLLSDARVKISRRSGDRFDNDFMHGDNYGMNQSSNYNNSGMNQSGNYDNSGMNQSGNFNNFGMNQSGNYENSGTNQSANSNNFGMNRSGNYDNNLGMNQSGNYDNNFRMNQSGNHGNNFGMNQSGNYDNNFGMSRSVNSDNYSLDSTRNNKSQRGRGMGFSQNASFGQGGGMGGGYNEGGGVNPYQESEQSSEYTGSNRRMGGRGMGGEGMGFTGSRNMSGNTTEEVNSKGHKTWGNSGGEMNSQMGDGSQMRPSSESVSGGRHGMGRGMNGGSEGRSGMRGGSGGRPGMGVSGSSGGNMGGGMVNRGEHIGNMGMNRASGSTMEMGNISYPVGGSSSEMSSKFKGGNGQDVDLRGGSAPKTSFEKMGMTRNQSTGGNPQNTWGSETTEGPSQGFVCGNCPRTFVKQNHLQIHRAICGVPDHSQY